MSKIYKTCNPTIKFWNYEFNNKLLDGVTLLKVTSGVIWTQPNIYIYIYIYLYPNNALYFFYLKPNEKSPNFVWQTIFLFYFCGL